MARASGDVLARRPGTRAGALVAEDWTSATIAAGTPNDVAGRDLPALANVRTPPSSSCDGRDRGARRRDPGERLALVDSDFSRLDPAADEFQSQWLLDQRGRRGRARSSTRSTSIPMTSTPRTPSWTPATSRARERRTPGVRACSTSSSRHPSTDHPRPVARDVVSVDHRLIPFVDTEDRSSLNQRLATFTEQVPEPEMHIVAVHALDADGACVLVPDPGRDRRGPDDRASSPSHRAGRGRRVHPLRDLRRGRPRRHARPLGGAAPRPRLRWRTRRHERLRAVANRTLRRPRLAGDGRLACRAMPCSTTGARACRTRRGRGDHPRQHPSRGDARCVEEISSTVSGDTREPPGAARPGLPRVTTRHPTPSRRSPSSLK